ncbi:MAG: flagellar basal-body MS-ring/collar protein FliF [Terriglobales bacterium]
MALALNSGQSLQALRQASTLVQGLSRRQKITMVAAVAGVVLAVVILVRVMAKPADASLYTGLQPADAQQVAAQLAALNIPYTLSADGASISVPAPDLDRARLQMAAQGLPHSGQLGFELFDKTNWSGSDFAEQVNYQRALEGELERTIETIQGVQTARVTLTMAHDSLFTAEERPAKGAVLLQLRGASLAPNMVSAIQHLVASSVENLSPANVAVMDSSGDLAVDGSGGAQGPSRLEHTLSQKIIATLAPIVGAAHVRASVSVALDPTSSDATQETYDPAGSAVLSSTRTSAGNPGTLVPAGVPGTTSNLPKVQAPGTNFQAQLGLSGGQGQESESATYAVSRSVDHVVRPAGTIQRMTAAVLVDDATATVTRNGHPASVPQPRSPQEMQQLQSLAAAAIGLNPTRGDVLTISNLAFAAPPPPVPAAPAPRSLPLSMPTMLRWLALAACLLLLGGLLIGRGMRSRKPAAASRAAAAQLSPGSELAAPNAAAAPPISNVNLENLNITEMLGANPDDTPPEVRQVLQLKDRVVERVRRDPAIAGRLVQVWMSKSRREERA